MGATGEMSLRSSAKINGGCEGGDLESDDDHSSIASSGDYLMKTPPLESILHESSEATAKNNGKKDSTKGVKPRYHRNRLQKVVREYALKVIFAYRDEIHTDAGTFRPIPEPQRKALWDAIVLKILRRYPSAVTTGNSLKSLWRTALWKVRKNKATFQEYVARVDAGLAPDELPSFSDIEVQIYRWLRTTTAFEPTVFTDESWLSQTGLPVTVSSSNGDDIPFVRSNPSSSNSSESGNSVIMEDEEVTSALRFGTHPQTSALQPIIDPRTSISVGTTKSKRPKHWRKAERDTLIRLVIEHKDSLFDNSAASAISSSGGDRIEVWNRILTKFLKKFPSTKASAGSLRRLWRSCRDKIRDQGHEYARYLNGAVGPLPPGAASPLTEAELDLYRWLTAKSEVGAPDASGQSTMNTLHSETSSAEAMTLDSAASWLFIQQSSASASTTDSNTLSNGEVAVPATQASVTAPVGMPSSEHSLQSVRLRLVQALNHIRQLEGELRDISVAVQTISNAQQASVPISEVELMKEENLRLKEQSEILRAENERLKSEKTEFLGSLSRYLSENRTVGERVAVSSSSSSTLPSATMQKDTQLPYVHGYTSVKEERT
ncbi:hypothetical protein Tcan_04302 [Toxocara canis]|uniref:Regulatory protein zeste n=1 Tax=Toxocara canis TaxID=6265 RepID=A0A0B2V5G4_TOXCA|nr:hypothetical protein Tcan_04302 [Toxocara canis]